MLLFALVGKMLRTYRIIERSEYLTLVNRSRGWRLLLYFS